MGLFNNIIEYFRDKSEENKQDTDLNTICLEALLKLGYEKRNINSSMFWFHCWNIPATHELYNKYVFIVDDGRDPRNIRYVFSDNTKVGLYNKIRNVVFIDEVRQDKLNQIL